jgi:hypothetical protein
MAADSTSTAFPTAFAGFLSTLRREEVAAVAFIAKLLRAISQKCPQFSQFARKVQILSPRSDKFQLHNHGI